jgi:hypothetical protein
MDFLTLTGRIGVVGFDGLRSDNFLDFSGPFLVLWRLTIGVKVLCSDVVSHCFLFQLYSSVSYLLFHYFLSFWLKQVKVLFIDLDIEMDMETDKDKTTDIKWTRTRTRSRTWNGQGHRHSHVIPGHWQGSPSSYTDRQKRAIGLKRLTNVKYLTYTVLLKLVLHAPFVRISL